MKHEEVFWKGVTQPSGQWHEQCSFTPIATSASIPDYLFQVTMTDVENKTLLTDFRLLFQPDSATCDFILEHPTWQKEPR
jgi:hypothetical protein